MDLKHPLAVRLPRMPGGCICALTSDGRLVYSTDACERELRAGLRTKPDVAGPQ